MIYVPDVARALGWYTSIGFKEIDRVEDDGVVNFGMVAFGGAEVMLNMHGRPRPHDVSLWFHTGPGRRPLQRPEVAATASRSGGTQRRSERPAGDRVRAGHRGHVLWRAAVRYPRSERLRALLHRRPYVAGVIAAFTSWPGTLSLRPIRFDRCQRGSRASRASRSIAPPGLDFPAARRPSPHRRSRGTGWVPP